MTPTIRPISWDTVHAWLASEVDKPFMGRKVFGVPKGGMILAGFCRLAKPVSRPEDADIIIDDIADSGVTRRRYQERFPAKTFIVMIDKTCMSPSERVWYHFPWEEEESGPEDAVIRLLEYIGEDPTREGLIETPKRVLKALAEMTRGYSSAPPEILLEKRFKETYDEMVILRDISFVSMCEHHMLPFTGKATVAYVPDKQVVGISKLARIVESFACRLQVQERMTKQIAAALQENLKPLGTGVLIEAHHECMSCRGVKQTTTSMVTSALTGCFLEQASCRAEFLGLIRNRV